MLKVENLSAAYGAIKAVSNVSIEVKPGEIVAILGANGAGKTTLLKCICSAMRKSEGSILFEGKKTPDKPYDVVKLGITLVPEGRLIFTNLTVYENLMAGAYLCKDKNEVKENLEKVYALFPILKERKNQYGGYLSGGEQQMLAIGRALMIRPKLIMLDEPSLGLAPIIVSQIFQIIQSLQSTGTSILLVEQNAYKALAISNRAYIMNVGKIVKEGTPEELLKDSALLEAYLGT
ncbi:ABC transporter ATP-binding protein [Tepidanaerobacter syntrophicus]|uniref:ABC transporter ATP-binding protein n=1 Tax=Tepidanaerobacter syntrophicus TaxID=224999 RepID=UPI0017515830|nr:ABC transporter ATP-binding protein [Tepidanaerobacter syntrophicus]GLI50476.1 ABC transporter ATP-binding protein [Tepidanaerobacter syntrophicus]HHV82624.1 ABC transporter ATP-binding protein [Tepidanaerobacter syntrophicus]